MQNMQGPATRWDRVGEATGAGPWVAGSQPRSVGVLGVAGKLCVLEGSCGIPEV